jgi:hypothetical protein
LPGKSPTARSVCRAYPASNRPTLYRLHCGPS